MVPAGTYYLPPSVVELLRKLYRDTSATISYKGQLDTKAFDILVGVLQGDVASPVFWIIYLSIRIVTSNL